MLLNGHQKAGKMFYEAASTLPDTLRNPSRPKRRYGRTALMIVVASVLLTAPLAYGAPAGGAGRGDPHVFRVVDKNAKLVGYMVTENMVAREINGVWVTFYVHPAVPDGIFNSDAIYLHYLTTNCSGTAYITHYSTFSEGTRVGSKLYYPADQQQLNPLSLRVEYGNGQPGPCYPASNIPGVYGVATTVDIDSFGLELPFRAVQ
jgi:hypothetical protein